MNIEEYDFVDSIIYDIKFNEDLSIGLYVDLYFDEKNIILLCEKCEKFIRNFPPQIFDLSENEKNNIINSWNTIIDIKFEVSDKLEIKIFTYSLNEFTYYICCENVIIK